MCPETGTTKPTGSLMWPGKDGPMWNSSETKEKIEAIRACFDGGVSDEHDKKVKSRSGAGLIAQTAERIQNEIKSFQKE